MNLENDLYRRIETTKHLDRFFVTGLEDLRIRMKDLRIRMKYYEGFTNKKNLSWRQK